MRKDNKRKNSILALFMSFAIAISGLGVPGISYVSAADEGNRSPVEKAVETPALEKASGMTNKEKVTNAEGKKMSASEEKEAWSVGDNPDHLKGPEKASPYPVILDSKADPYLGKEGKKRARRSTSTLRAPGQGAVELTKKAEPVPGKLNTFKVTLRMEATDKEQKNDIVLVIDTSGSMNDDRRMIEAKKAAKNFVNKLLDEEHPNTRIALVSFETNAHLKKNFTNYTNKQELLNAIDGLHANGGTFTQGGIREASNLLNSSQADFKNIVLLSDGVPTFNYEIYNPDDHVIPGGPNHDTIHERETGPNVPQSAFNYSETTGAGNSMWHRYKWAGSVKYYYNSGNCAIAEAGFAKQKGIKVYTVAVNAGAQGNGVLEKTATPGCSYSTEDPTALNGIFGQIAASIASAMKNAKVTDPMGAGFEVKGGTASNVQVTQGTVTLNNNTISWNVGTLTNSVSPGSMTRYAEMTYEVVINDSILDVVSPADGNYNTNAGATVHYTDIDGNQQTKAFPEPKAKPLIIELHKKLLDFKGREIPSAYAKGRKFNFNMKLKEDAGFNQDYLVPGNKSKVMVDLRIDKTYELKENSISGNPASNLSDYDSTIEWKTWDGTKSIEPIEGTYLDKFVVPRGGSENDPLNTKITVTNKEKKLGKLKLKKTFNPSSNGGGLAYSLKGGLYRSTPKFKITVVGINPYGGDDEVYREVHELYAGQEKTIENLPYGHYTVSEQGHEPVPTFVDSDGVNDGKVDLLINKKEASVEVINRPKDDDYDTEVTASKTWVNGPETDHKAPTFELYADGVLKTDAEPTVTPENGTANKFTYKWTNLQKYNNSGKEITYTVKEKNVTADNKLVVNGHTYAVMQQGNDITNTYEVPKDGEVNVTKVWKDPDGKTIAKPKVNLTLYRKVGTGAEEKVPGADVKVVDGTTTAAKWTGLETTDINGKPYKFIVKESFKDADDVNNGNWTLVESTDVENGKATITNKAVTGDDNLGKLTVTKKPLVNGAGVRSAARGPAGLRGTPLKFSFKVTGPNGYEETFDLAPTESKVLKGLYFGEYKVEETDSKGYTATYSVVEGKVTLKSTDKEKTVEVTNTNGGEGTVVAKTVEKIWVNGPKPSVTIELWRTNKVDGADKIDEKVDEFVVPEGASGNDLKKTFTKLAKHDSKGNEFEYYVKEDNVPANYTKSIEGLKVTNTYKIPTGGEVNVTKVWKDPDGKTIAKPEVNLTLYRKIEGGAEEKVPGADVKVVDGTTTAAKWTGLETTDINGKPYKFIVKESFKDADDVNNGNWTLVESTDVENGKATITNKAVTGDDNLGKLTVTKNPLVNGAGVRSGVRGPAGLRGTPLKFSFKVTGPNGYEETFDLSPTESKVLKGLYFGEYKVEETDSKGYTASYSVVEGKVTLKSTDKEKTVEVTNTNGGEGTVVEKTVEKVWVNGPKPSVTIELWRTNKVEGADKIDEKVGEFVVPESASGNDLKKTFTKLAKHDPKGNEYEYYVKEDNVPANYTKRIEGLKVTNTYAQPQTDEDVKATKKWVDADSFNPKPEIKFELWRKNGTAGAGEKVIGTQDYPNPQTVPEGGEVNFGKQLKTDINGVEYKYYVKEIFTNAEERDNWIIKGEGSLEVTNTLKGESDRDGKLTIRKALVNEHIEEPELRGAAVRAGGNKALKFKFTVKGPGGYSKEVELKAGEEITLDKLLYGKYKVKEVDNHGFVPSYNPENGEVILKADANEATVTITNTNDGGDKLNVKKTIKKIWVNGDKPATKIQLWRKGTAADGTAIDEMVNEFTTTAGQDSEKEFTKTSKGILLAKYDPQGNEFEYYAKEVNVPANYEATYSDDKLTVTNTYVKPDDKTNTGSKKVKKVKTGDNLMLKLYGGTGAVAMLLIVLMLVVRSRIKRKEQE